MLTLPNTASDGASLRAIVQNGPVLDLTGAHLVFTDSLTADRFSLSARLPPVGDLFRQFWTSQTNIEIDVQGQHGGWGGYKSVIIGKVDSLSIDPIRNTLDICGRDLTSRLIQTPTRETFVNQTASEIAISLAIRHGLAPDVTRSESIVGRPDASGRARVSLPHHTSTATHWDILANLARAEDFEVYVSGSTLHFHPRVESVGLINKDIDCRDLLDLHVERVLPLAERPLIAIESWNSRAETTTRIDATLETSSSRQQQDGLDSGTATFPILLPNLTNADAKRLMAQYSREITRAQMRVMFSQAHAVDLPPRSIFRLTGTDGLDGIYKVAMLEQRFHPHRGYRQNVTAYAID